MLIIYVINTIIISLQFNCIESVSLLDVKIEDFDINEHLFFELYTKEQPINNFQQIKIDLTSSLTSISNASPTIGFNSSETGGAIVGTTHTNNYSTVENNLSATHFNVTRPTRILIHGYFSSRKLFLKYAKAYLAHGDYNVIAVNWLHGALTVNYLKAKNRVNEIGIAVAKLIDFLVRNGMKLDDLIVIGHSLGAHIAGIAGKYILSGRLRIIIGLDPASPSFSNSLQDQLIITDANYVYIIHTSKLGIKQTIGHIDFYPNGGRKQPGCGQDFTGVCSHRRVHDYFLESLTSNSEFWASPCMTYVEVKGRTCSGSGPNILMGGDENLKKHIEGVYFLQTNSQSPFAMVHYN